MAYIDVAGFVADLKEHAVDHGFHVHDERHFVETYSLRQTWEVDLHPEEACNGPIDLHLALDVDPRVLLSFEDEVGRLDDPDDSPPDVFQFPLIFQWTLPPLPDPPDLLVLATELAGVGGVELPVEVSAIDSFPSVTDAPERSLQIVAKVEVSLSPRVHGRGARAALRHPRPLPGRQPVPARAGARLARRVVRARVPVKVHELIEILGDCEPDLEVEMAIVCPVDQPDDRVAVDRYPIEVVLPYSDDDDPSDVLWLVGGEESRRGRLRGGHGPRRRRRGRR